MGDSIVYFLQMVPQKHILLKKAIIFRVHPKSYIFYPSCIWFNKLGKKFFFDKSIFGQYTHISLWFKSCIEVWIQSLYQNLLHDGKSLLLQSTANWCAVFFWLQFLEFCQYYHLRKPGPLCSDFWTKFQSIMLIFYDFFFEEKSRKSLWT